MTGSSYYFDPAMAGISYSPYSDPEISDTLLDKLMGRMMEHTRLVIIPCKWCGSHNAFSNSTCIKCGGPMGEVNGK